MNTGALLPIGEVAAATGVAVSALRHYDELGVITAAERIGGKRRFTSDVVARVNFVRRAQRFGFTLQELRDILNDSSGSHRQIVEDKIASLRAQQIELAATLATLEELRDCGCGEVVGCPMMNDHS